MTYCRAWKPLVLLVLCTLATTVHGFQPLPPSLAAQGTIQAAFAPWNDVEKLIIDEIDTAKRQILVQAYLLTSKKIMRALIDAHKRQIDVRVLMDATQSNKTPASKGLALVSAGVPVWLETDYQNAHNKVIIIDGGSATPVLMTGSYNYTSAAAHQNAENLLVIRNNSALTLQYVENWERHQQHATPFRN